jgi:hypothetical protein
MGPKGDPTPRRIDRLTPSPQQNSWLSFMLEVESNPWSYCGFKDGIN